MPVVHLTGSRTRFRTCEAMGSATVPTVFFTLVRTREDVQRAKLLVESLREFGGRLGESDIWVFLTESEDVSWGGPEDERTHVIGLSVPGQLKGYLFSGKVSACAEAERRANKSVGSLVWMSSDTMIVQPPVHYELGRSHDAAFRPVHIRNIGLPADAPLDAFWTRIYGAVGMTDIQFPVESFVDRQRIRAYFNTHSCSVRPSLGLFSAWRDHFETLVADRDFQAGPCSDELHRVFLHQAILSALAVRFVPRDRLELLPSGYSYPYNLQSSIPESRRAARLGDLVTVVYEDLSIDPDEMNDIVVGEPLRSWLTARASIARQ